MKLLCVAFAWLGGGGYGAGCERECARDNILGGQGRAEVRRLNDTRCGAAGSSGGGASAGG